VRRNTFKNIKRQDFSIKFSAHFGLQGAKKIHSSGVQEKNLKLNLGNKILGLSPEFLIFYTA